MKRSLWVLMCLISLPGASLAAEPALADTAAQPTANHASAVAVSADAIAPAPPSAAAAPTVTTGLTGGKTLVEKLREQPARPRETAPSVSTMLGGLVMTLGLLFALAWLARRLRLAVPGMSQGMRLESAVALGPREKLCTVTRGDKVYVLGVTQHSVTLIDTEPAPSPAPVADTQFSDRIKKLLQDGAPHGK